MGRASICLCLAAETIEADLKTAEAYRGKADLLELRADHLRPEELARAGEFPRQVDLPVILTIRRVRDGGLFAGDERGRIAVLDRLVAAGFRYIDIEEDLDAPGLEARIAAAGVRIIRSLHDHVGVSPDLAARIARLARRPSEIPKAAVMPKSTADLARLLAVFSASPRGERILLGMGDFGFPTRILATRLGSFLCYTSPAGAVVAPGQVDPDTLESLYRFRSIGPATSVYGVIGNPVMHSRSPRIHNFGLGALGRDAVYLPFLVDDVDAFWEVADALEVRGLSVTAPHKQTVMRHLSEEDDVVRATGACNTLVRERVGAPWKGANTDSAGFLAPLRELLGGALPRGLGATVIGAGGAARAVVHALTASGVRVLVLNRGAQRGRRLAADFAVQCEGLDERGFAAARSYTDLVVQTTSVGMAPGSFEDPAPGLVFTGREIVYELVYSPPVTPLLRRALDAGCRVVQGMRMLQAQAMEQFRLFTGAEYPAEARAALEKGRD
jgi:3-dehydroquinate dehydratase / shikimate dehydrogenase